MQVEATDVIRELTTQIAEQAQTIAVLRAQLRTLRTPVEEGPTGDAAPEQS